MIFFLKYFRAITRCNAEGYLGSLGSTSKLSLRDGVNLLHCLSHLFPVPLVLTFISETLFGLCVFLCFNVLLYKFQRLTNMSPVPDGTM